MGHRTLSLGLVFRALFLDTDAYDQLRDDDNPFVEGLFLIVIIGAITALLSLIGQFLAWAGSPSLNTIRDLILTMYQRQSWWSAISGNAEALRQFQQWWDLGWQIFPNLAGAPNPATAAFNILLWPLAALLSWFVYGLLAHLFARIFGGKGTVGQTLGTLALAFTPLLLRGLGFIPYFTVGAVMSTWQLLCRYKAVRSVHRLSWGRALGATVLPFLVYLLFWLLVGGIGAAVIAVVVRR